MSKQYMDFAPRKGAAKKPAKPAVKRPVVSVPVKPAVKRPAPKSSELGVVEELRSIKSEKLVSGLGTKLKPADKVFKMPKPQFINQDKIIKRPLSKNVYRKKVVVPDEEPKGPVTIITKPDKQAHVSLIVTIILTIILGAAAGTVAFLLLPR